VLNVRDLRICRGNTLILDNISWQIERRQHWVILGANGSGKTSLLKALNGYLTPNWRRDFNLWPTLRPNRLARAADTHRFGKLLGWPNDAQTTNRPSKQSSAAGMR
jgi:ATPase subunit of ABC transporter with duplicated ATPase domains